MADGQAAEHSAQNRKHPLVGGDLESENSALGVAPSVSEHLADGLNYNLPESDCPLLQKVKRKHKGCVGPSRNLSACKGQPSATKEIHSRKSSNVGQGATSLKNNLTEGDRPQLQGEKRQPKGRVIASKGKQNASKERLSTNSSNVGPGTTSQKGGHDPTDWEMELIYHRLIQMSYLDVISAKASKKQEEQAKSQIYWLWKQVELLKEEVAALTVKFEREEREIALYKTLDVQEKGLGPVCSEILSIEQSYETLMHALDSTRHSMAVDAIHPKNEDEFESELAGAEEQLREINAFIQEKKSKVVEFSTVMEDLVHTLKDEHQELRSVQKDIKKALKTSVEITSHTIHKGL